MKRVGRIHVLCYIKEFIFNLTIHLIQHLTRWNICLIQFYEMNNVRIGSHMRRSECWERHCWPQLPFPASSFFSKLTVLWSLNHKVFKSLSMSLLGWEWSGAQFTVFFASSFIYSFAELALVPPNAVDSSHHIMTLVSVQALISHLETNKHQS